MKIIRVDDYDEMSKVACSILAKKINQKKHLVLGLATGSTPEGLYKLLIEKYRQGEVSFKHVKSFNLDEYVGLAKDHPNSYYHFMNHKLFSHVDIPIENVHIPNGVAHDLSVECESYEATIKAEDGIDLQLLGIGENGHIGFNEPGTRFTSRTQVVNLEASTIQANSRFFDSVEEVPTQAISMGIATIMESKEILLLASGEKKSQALAKLLYGNLTEDVPATILQKHEKVTIVADRAALSGSLNEEKYQSSHHKNMV